MVVDVMGLIAQDDQRRVRFLTGARRRWSTDLYSQMRDEYEAIVAECGAPSTREEAGALIERCPSYAWFGWLERGAQKLKWRVINGIVDTNWEVLARSLTVQQGPAHAELDPGLVLPDWYEEWDIHCQPGGVWGDSASAFVYEIGTKVLHIGQNSRNELHQLFTRSALKDRDFERIVDLGSGFGKSTQPIKEQFPEAEVIGIELSGPCVELAAARASEAGLAITYRQAAAAQTGLDHDSVGLVTGTMVLHEMPVPALREVFAETARILEPGGICRFLEFCRTGDKFRDAVMDDHAWRNNEPFMPGLMDLDIAAELGAAGLVDQRWIPFDERGVGPVPHGFPDRTEWHFPWAVLEARKPVS